MYYEKFQILNVKQINMYVICLFMNRFHHNLLPEVLDHYFTLNRNVHAHGTRQRQLLHVPTPSPVSYHIYPQLKMTTFHLWIWVPSKRWPSLVINFCLVSGLKFPHKCIHPRKVVSGSRHYNSFVFTLFSGKYIQNRQLTSHRIFKSKRILYYL